MKRKPNGYRPAVYTLYDDQTGKAVTTYRLTDKRPGALIFLVNPTVPGNCDEIQARVSLEMALDALKKLDRNTVTALEDEFGFFLDDVTSLGNGALCSGCISPPG